MDRNSHLATECQERLQRFQIDCYTVMSARRGVVDDETFDILSRAYAISGNAAREIGLLIKEIEVLRSRLNNK